MITDSLTNTVYFSSLLPGVVEAQFNIAMFYMFGRGVRKNQAKCLKWLTKAAEQGDEKAQYNLIKLGKSKSGSN